MILKDNQLLKLNKELEKRTRFVKKKEKSRVENNFVVNELEKIREKECELDKQRVSLEARSFSGMISEEDASIERLRLDLESLEVLFDEYALVAGTYRYVITVTEILYDNCVKNNDFIGQMVISRLRDRATTYEKELLTLIGELGENIKSMRSHYKACLNNKTPSNIQIQTTTANVYLEAGVSVVNKMIRVVGSGNMERVVSDLNKFESGENIEMNLFEKGEEE